MQTNYNDCLHDYLEQTEEGNAVMMQTFLQNIWYETYLFQEHYIVAIKS